jgi:hypothetical protein
MAMMGLSGITHYRRGHVLGWALGCAILAMPAAAPAQILMRPAEKPLVTAENERWYLAGQAITFSGSIYDPAGAAVFFNPYEMVRSGAFEGVPLFSKAAREPFGVVYVPVGRGLMQPYERRGDGDGPGVGRYASSYPAHRDSEVWGTGPQAAGPPTGGDLLYTSQGYATSHDAGTPMDPSRMTPGRTPVAARAAGPLTSALEPTGLNAFFIQYQGRRWFSSGPAVPLDESNFSRAGEYRGFPVYVAGNQPADTIYVAVAADAPGLLTPYSSVRR